MSTVNRQFGFVRVAAVSPRGAVADCVFNADKIIAEAMSLSDSGVKVIVFPELSITGYTCGDLFLQRALLDSAKAQLLKIAEETKKSEALILVGLPILHKGALYNCAALINRGRVLGFVPKTYIPTYGEFYEGRHFTSGAALGAGEAVFLGEKLPLVPITPNLLVTDKNNSDFCLAVELCEDLWVPSSPSAQHVRAGATIIANLSASNEIIGKADYRRGLVKYQSAKNICAYILANAGKGESTSDVVYSAHNLIFENARALKESKLFNDDAALIADCDLQLINQERLKMKTFFDAPSLQKEYLTLEVALPVWSGSPKELKRPVSAFPFVPEKTEVLFERSYEVVTLQSQALARRLRHTGLKKAVVGVSGGLDSTLALLVTLKAFALCDLDASGVLAFSMSGPGTSSRTKANAKSLALETGATLKEVSIDTILAQHFLDIGQDASVHDTTYENCQARLRTLILMDSANKEGALVIGTGDMSELALGWCTYNGDHMAMYNVNAGVPKTLVRHLVEYFARENEKTNEALSATLRDILATPVSPELLPPQSDGSISQKTEDLVGPYELHDFFLYYMVRYGFPPAKILFLADKASLPYSHEEKLKWLRVFYKRFFAMQFKRNCAPDTVKVGTVALSPRGDWRMPTDAQARVWQEEVFNIE